MGEAAPEPDLAAAGVAIEATAATTCEPGYLYYTTSYTTNPLGYVALMRYSTSSGTTTLVKQFPDNKGLAPLSPDALGVSSNGYAYLINQLPVQGAAPTILGINLSTGVQTSYTGTTLNAAYYNGGGTGATFPAGAVSPLTGIYYYGYPVGTGASWDFYAFNTNTNTAIGFVGRINTGSSIAYQGDIAFDGDGNLYLAIQNSNAPVYKVAVGDLSTTAQNSTKVLTTSTAGSQPEPTFGLAYMSAEATRPLWSINMGSPIQKRTPGVNDAITGPTINSYVNDLASCVTPSGPTLSLSKNVEGRTKSTDQFTLAVKSGSSTLASATTTGTATGIQAAKAGPVAVTAGSSYTLQETASGTTKLSDYAITASCTMGGSPVSTTGSNGTFAVTIPTDAVGLIDCVITNGPPTLQLKKNVVGRVAASDQFKIEVASGSGAALATATTTGSATGIQAATATAPVSPGTTYRVQESGVSTNMNLYQVSTSCSVNGVEVPATALSKLTFELTVPEGTTGVVECVITNTPNLTLALTKNVVGRVNDTDQFTLSMAQGDGTAVGTAVTTVGTTNGVQGVKVGPVEVEAGQTYTIKEAGAAGATLSEYDTSATCKAADGSAIPTTGSNGTWSLTIPAGAMGAVSCEIKNVAPPTITVTKTIPNSRFAASDQFTVALRTGGATGTVLDTPGNETTEGTGSEVTTGTGTTGRFRATAGTSYTITETPGAGVDMTKYAASLTCTDATGTQAGLPSGTPLGEGLTITPQAGAQISCTLSNASTSGAGVGIGEGLTCEAGYIYTLLSRYTGSSGTDAWTQVGKVRLSDGQIVETYNRAPNWNGQTWYNGNTNALAISQGGLYSYYSTQRYSVDPNVLPVFQQDNKTGATKLLGTMAIPNNMDVSTVRGGINPVDGIYWVSSSVGNTHYFWAYNTLTNVNYGYVGSITGPATMAGTNGDLVFDQEGNMLIVTSVAGASYLNRVTGMNATLAAGNPSNSTRNITTQVGIQLVTTLAASGVYNGITFDNDGLLWMQYYNSSGVGYVAGFDPNTGERVAGPVPLSNTGTGRTGTDLADCNDPGGIRLQKDYPLGRVAAEDNVTLKIVRSDRPTTNIVGGTATTNGPATGLQTNAAAVAIGVPGNSYVLTETVASGSPLSSYSTTLSCVDKTHGNAAVAVTRNSQGEYILPFPGVTTEDGQLLANVVCTYVNTPKAEIAVEKVGSTQCLIPGAEPTDVNYTYTVTNPGVVALRDIALTDDKGDTEYVSGDLDSNGMLDPGEIWVYTMTSALTQTTTNRATVTGVNPANGEVATATDTWTVAPSPVTVTKTSSATGPVKAGDELTYTMVVTNTGTTDATNVELTDTLPDGVTYVDGSAQKTYWTGESTSGVTKTGTYTTTLPNFSFPTQVGTNTSDRQTFTTVGTTVPANAQLTGYTVNLRGSSPSDWRDEVGARGFLPSGASWFTVNYGAFGTGEVTNWNMVARTGSGTLGTAYGEFAIDWLDKTGYAGYLNGNTSANTTVTLNYTYTEEASARTQVTNPAHAPGEMVTAADAVTLKPGESMTVTFKVTVDNPLDPAITELTNTAHVTHDGDAACASGDSVTDPIEGAPSTPIHVEKLGQHCDVGQDTCALPGAEFALYDTDPSLPGAQPITNGIAVDANNGALFTSIELKPGNYWLVETKAPNGFTLLPAPIQFTLSAQGITLNDVASGNVSLKADDALTILVTDTTPAPLPEAGGSGPGPFLALGILLLAVGGIYQKKTSDRRPARVWAE